MKLLNTAIIRLSLVLLAGIFTGSYISIPLSWLFFLLAGIFIIFISAFLRAQRLLLQDRIFGASCLCLFFFLGILSVQLDRPGNQSLHYSNLVQKKDPVIFVRITEELKPDLFRNKYLAEVLRFNASETHGKILILLPLENGELKPSDQLVLASRLDPIPKSLNPQQFNYREFMANRGILFQTAPSPAEFFTLDPAEKDAGQAAQNFREEIITKLRSRNFGKEELAVIQALLLGQRRDLSQETNENYAQAGVMHILAVSGLHVGILLLLLNNLLSFLDSWKWGKPIKTVLLLLLLWGYALLAGLSPSIVRAVCMFSFVAIGMQLKRQTSVLNSLFLSLMFLLLAQPNWAFEVGFQLSYLAVFSIVLLQPLLFNLYPPKSRILRYFWSMFTVTLAAQLGVMPLSLFYFHQFPGLFFLSNMLILPFLGLILGLGSLVLLLSTLDLLPELFVKGFNILINLLNQFVEWVAQQENFIFQDIQFSLLPLFAFYALLLLTMILLKGFSIKKLSLLLGAIICLQGVVILETWQNNYNELIVFHKSRHSVIGQKENKHLKLVHDLKDPAGEQAFIRNYKLKRGITSLESAGFQNLYIWKEELVLVIDSSSIYQVPGLYPERIILTGSPQINLDRVLEDLRPKEIIADGSNYKSYVSRWRESCRKRKIPFHYTGEKGSYILR